MNTLESLTNISKTLHMQGGEDMRKLGVALDAAINELRALQEVRAELVYTSTALTTLQELLSRAAEPVSPSGIGYLLGMVVTHIDTQAAELDASLD